MWGPGLQRWDAQVLSTLYIPAISCNLKQQAIFIFMTKNVHLNRVLKKKNTLFESSNENRSRRSGLKRDKDDRFFIGYHHFECYLIQYQVIFTGRSYKPPRYKVFVACEKTLLIGIWAGEAEGALWKRGKKNSNSSSQVLSVSRVQTPTGRVGSQDMLLFVSRLA